MLIWMTYINHKRQPRQLAKNEERLDGSWWGRVLSSCHHIIIVSCVNPPVGHPCQIAFLDCFSRLVLQIGSAIYMHTSHVHCALWTSDTQQQKKKVSNNACNIIRWQYSTVQYSTVQYSTAAAGSSFLRHIHTASFFTDHCTWSFCLLYAYIILLYCIIDWKDFTKNGSDALYYFDLSLRPEQRCLCICLFLILLCSSSGALLFRTLIELYIQWRLHYQCVKQLDYYVWHSLALAS